MLSPGPTSTVTGKTDWRGNEILENLIIADVNSLPATKSKLDDYREAEQTDSICSEVIRFCRNSWPQKKEVKKCFIPFWNKQGELTICSGLFLLEKHIVIPKCKQYESLLKIHEGHQGINMLHESTSSSVVARHAPWACQLCQTMQDLCKRTVPKEGTTNHYWSCSVSLAKSSNWPIYF